MNKNALIKRSTMRGLRKCPSCDCYNGNRATGCANEKCSLHYLRKTAVRKKPLIDAVQLVSYNDTKIFSVRVKDRDPSQRNFVQIIDVTLTSDQDGSIVSRNAICFVDTCKYDSTDLNISCKHVKSASECSKQALEIKVTKDVLYGLNIGEDSKDSLWAQYTEHEHMIPAIQRVNKSTFVVKCRVNAVQASGRVHCTVHADDEANFQYSCGCKKLRIILSPNNSVVLENDVCDHLMLILAGILTTESLRKDYQKYLNATSNLWETEQYKIQSSLLETGDLISFSENILNSCIEFASAENTSDENIFNSDPTMQTSANNIMEDEEIQLISVATSTDDLMTEFQAANMEVEECQIELMDQLESTNQIDLDIQLCEDDLFAENHIVCSMDSLSQDNNFLSTPDNAVCTDSTLQDCLSIPVMDTVITSPPPEKRKRLNDSTSETNDEPLSTTLEFNAWLNFVIERINMAVDYNVETPVVVMAFDVKHDFFTYLSNRFSTGDKRRIPNSTSMIKKGKHKGLVKSSWIFLTATAIKRIFTTNESSIEFETVYIEKSPGIFESYDINSALEDQSDSQNKKLKRILPSLHKAFIQFGSKTKTSPAGYKIEWIPNVFPKSGFGIMRIQFNLGFKKNNKIFEKFPM